MKYPRSPIWLAFGTLMFIVAKLAFAQTNAGGTNAPPTLPEDTFVTVHNLWHALALAAMALAAWYARDYWPKIKAKLGIKPGDPEK